MVRSATLVAIVLVACVVILHFEGNLTAFAPLLRSPVLLTCQLEPSWQLTAAAYVHVCFERITHYQKC